MSNEGSGSDVTKFLQSWAWKREHRPDKSAAPPELETNCKFQPAAFELARFRHPYKHKVEVDGQPDSVGLTIKQQQFKEEGFASTVWDSSIVVAKFFEKHQREVRGKRCLDLSAGCGLVGITLAKLGAQVSATDLGPNLTLLRENCVLNGEPDIAVVEYEWGSKPLPGSPFDVVSTCDLMYIAAAIPQLVESLAAVSGAHTRIYVAHGRNRQAESLFFQQVDGLFTVTKVADTELDEKYQCIDVDVYMLQKCRP